MFFFLCKSFQKLSLVMKVVTLHNYLDKTICSLVFCQPKVEVDALLYSNYRREMENKEDFAREKKLTQQNKIALSCNNVQTTFVWEQLNRKQKRKLGENEDERIFFLNVNLSSASSDLSFPENNSFVLQLRRLFSGYEFTIH